MHSLDGELEEFISKAKASGLVVEEKRRFSPLYEPTLYIKSLEERGKIGVFYVKKTRCAANLIASRAILYRVLGARNDREAYTRLIHALNNPGRLVEKKFTDYFREASTSIEDLPAIKFYEKDGGLYITSGVFTACLNGECNASIHRIMVSSQGYVAVRVVPRHLYRMLESSKKGLPVAVSIGVNPAILVAAALSPPYGVFELKIASSILEAPLGVCPTPKYSLPVPCGASYVIEGVLGPERRREGPFVDLLGLYDRVREEPVLKIEEIYENIVYEKYFHVILPGGVEHKLLMGFPREAQIYEAVSKSVAQVSKVRLTLGGGMWLHAVVSIRKMHDGDGKTAGMAALAAHPSLKHVVVVDDDIDPDNLAEVEWAIATRLQASRGIIIVKYARGSTLDPSSADGLTDKIIVDATAPIASREQYKKPAIKPLEWES